MNFREMREQSGLTQQQLSDLLHIPLVTIRNWSAAPESKNHRQCPPYVIELIRYYLQHEGYIKREEQSK